MRPFNVFVGPNNAGKSNILDCLAFLSDLMMRGQGAVSSRGGFQYIVWGGDYKHRISIELEASVQEKEFNCQIELGGNPLATSMSRLILNCKVNSGWQKLINVESGEGSAWDIEGEELRHIKPQADWWWLGALRFLAPTHLSFADYIRSWEVYNPVPSRMQQPQPAKKALVLEPEGDNLSAVLHSLQSSHRHEFSEVENLAKTGLPELEELLTELTEQGQAYIAFKERGHPLHVPGWAISDGTLRLLAHLAVAYSPTPPALVGFEEPENHIHPRLHEHLLVVLKALSAKSQVLVTTHSPFFLDALRSEIRDLVVVEKAEGKTKCKRITRKDGLKKALKVLGLGELWYSGSIGGVPRKSD